VIHDRSRIVIRNSSTSKDTIMQRFVAIALSSTLVLQAAPLLAAGPAARKAPAAAAQTGQAPGAINGTATDSSGQTLPNYTVQLRNLQTGQLAGTTTSNAAGSFSFIGLAPANYAIEIVNAAGTIVGSSAAITVAAGASVTVTVSSAAAAIAGASAAGVSTALLVTTVAVAAGIFGVVVAVKHDASSSR
jgi:carboxypeptidase family protein